MLSEPLFKCFEGAILSMQKMDRDRDYVLDASWRCKTSWRMSSGSSRNSWTGRKRNEIVGLLLCKNLWMAFSDQQSRVDQLELAIIRADSAEKALNDRLSSSWSYSRLLRSAAGENASGIRGLLKMGTKLG
jgi:hypothetical protein